MLSCCTQCQRLWVAHPTRPQSEKRSMNSERTKGWRECPAAIALLLLCGVLMSCATTPKRFHVLVPAKCVQISVTSFTRPCIQRSDGKLVCDGVVISASCVQVAR
jgi:hypothetical protein